MKPVSNRIPSNTSSLSSRVSTKGYGLLKGVTKLKGAIHPYCRVGLLFRDTLETIRITVSDKDGNYSFKGVPYGVECVIIAFNPDRQMNAVIQDSVVPK